MLNEKKSKRGTVIALLCALALLALVILLENTMKPTGMLFTVLKKGAVYALVAVSMNLLNGFTGLFSLGQAGFMLLGAYSYAILTIPTADREAVYYLYNGSAVNFSLPELFGGGAVGLVLGVLLALFLGGCVAAAVAWLIGLPVLRLKSDYLAIATLGFAEIIRAIFQWDPLGPVTNGGVHPEGQRLRPRQPPLPLHREELPHLLQLQYPECRRQGDPAAIHLRTVSAGGGVCGGDRAADQLHLRPGFQGYPGR